jgi:hypothetical protein
MTDWKGVEYDTTCEQVLTQEQILKTLDKVSRHITLGWENDPILSIYCQPKPEPNKYQRRYARIGRRKKK